jgi:GntR family transcriptional regulator
LPDLLCSNLSMASDQSPAPQTSAATFSPLYRQIKSLILASLESGEWGPGEAIPSELELASRFKVSQGTVRKAVDELSAENLLIRRQGKGTYVATHSEPHAQFRFLRLRPLEGEAQYPEMTLIDCRRIRASGEAARNLELKVGEGIILLRRVLAFRGIPTVLDEISLPGGIFKGLSANKVNSYQGSLYNLFETEFGTRMIRADERIRSVPADAASAELLRVDVGTPLLSVDRVTFTYGNRAVEYRRGLYRTDQHYYANVLA